MESTLETVALFALKLAHETDDASPVLRDDPIMAAYEREAFGLLVRNGDIAAIQLKLGQCVAVALTALGGAQSVMGRELQTLATEVDQAQTLETLHAPLLALRDYLKDIQ